MSVWCRSSRYVYLDRIRITVTHRKPGVSVISIIVSSLSASTWIRLCVRLVSTYLVCARVSACMLVRACVQFPHVLYFVLMFIVVFVLLCFCFIMIFTLDIYRLLIIYSHEFRNVEHCLCQQSAIAATVKIS